MASLLKKPRDSFFQENIFNSKEIPLNFEIESKNTFHSFDINFQISKKDLFDETIRPIELFDNSVDRVLAINLRLKNNENQYYNKNNEQIEVKEFYQDIYTLEELKNNVKGLEWFTDLTDFKKAFINAITKNKYELSIIKNVLLLNMTIINYFGDTKICNLIIRPFINKVSPSNFWNLSCKYDLVKKETYIKNKPSFPKQEKKSVTNQPGMNLLINKKRLRPIKKSPKKLYTIDTSSFNSNQENEKTQSDSNENYVEDLPEFESDALAKESNIIRDLSEEALIGNAITHSEKKYRLIYKASKDGDSANKFHNKCDKHSNLIILIKTKKGLRFGGFTSAKFRSSSHLKYDNDAFLFSLDIKKVFNIIPNSYAIYCYDNTGPSFYKGSLYVPNKFFTNYGKTCLAGGPFQFKKDFELNNGEEKFLIEELEVFQVKTEKISIC